MKHVPKQINLVARVVHESIRSYQRELGENIAPNWDESEEWQRTATFAAVQFQFENPNALPPAHHEQWMREKYASGWQYGPVKDPLKKTHPSLVPYDRLPESERRKDMLVAAVVKALTDPVT